MDGLPYKSRGQPVAFRFIFPADLTGELNELHSELQGKDKDVFNMMSSVNTLNSKLLLMPVVAW